MYKFLIHLFSKQIGVLLLFVFIYFKIEYMHFCVFTEKWTINPIGLLENISTAIIDTSLLLCVFIPLISWSSKNISIFLLIIIDIFTLANIWYSRNFHAYIPISLYCEFNNLHGLKNNIIDSIKVLDCIIPISTIIFTIITQRILHIIPPKCQWKVFLSFLGLAILLTGLFFCSTFLKSYTLKDKFISPYMYSPTESTFRNGITYHFIMEIKTIDTTKQFSEEDQKFEPLFFAQSSNIRPINSSNNIIIIIVESFLSYANDLYFNGKAITPNLNQLKKENTYYFSHILPQTKSGESSDGQIIYLTGLLPQTNKITVVNYSDNQYISFPYLLKQHHKIQNSHMIIPTNSNFWRQNKMCATYQIDSLFSRNDYHSSNIWLNDEEVFELAATKNLTAQQPFLSIILTSSTHSPYNETVEVPEHFDFPQDYSCELKNYLTTLHYTDKQIGKYIQFLKDNNLYYNSMIIIVSDHEAHASNLNLSPNQEHIAKEIPLYIINPPLEITKSPHDTIQQIDIFPTLLDLTGIQSPWRGVGRSLLMPDFIANSPHEKERRKNAQKISDIIIRSDYFKTHQIINKSYPNQAVILSQ